MRSSLSAGTALAGFAMLCACATPPRAIGPRQVLVDNAGVRIAAIHYPAAGAASRRHPVLLVHGMVARAEQWFEPGRDGLVQALHARGFGVIAVSLRGRGGSDCPAEGWGADDMAGDIEAVVRELAPGGVLVVAHSQGTGYALRFAQRSPGLVHGFVAGDYAPGIGMLSREWVQGVNAKRDPGVLCATAAQAMFDAQPPVPVIVDGLEWSMDLRPALRLPFPVLVLQGAIAGGAERSVVEAEWAPREVHWLPEGVTHDLYRFPAAIDATVQFLREGAAP